MKKKKNWLSGNVLKKIGIVVGSISLIATLLFLNCFSKTINGEDIWMGWANIYYDGLGYGACPSYDDSISLDINKYGKYGFNYKTNLVDFLKYLDSEYFEKWINYGKNSEKLISIADGLPAAFSEYYANNKEYTTNKEDMYIYENYYLPIKQKLLSKNINLDNYSEFLKGAILSMTIRKIDNNEVSQEINDSFLSDFVSSFDNENEENTITNIYKIMLGKYGNTDENLRKIYKERHMCLTQRADKQTNVSEKLINNNINFENKYLLSIMATASDTYDEFLTNGKFKEDDQKEWYSEVRNNGFEEEFDIKSGFLDLAFQTSNGIKTAQYLLKVKQNCVLKKIDNGEGIYYIPQNSNDQSYSFKKFGMNNVSQGGGSVCCMAMAINRYKGNTKENLVLPDKVIDKIAENKGDYNYYYDSEKNGMKNEIITEGLSMYGMSASIISKNSLLSALQRGDLVIARVGKSEFATTGNFILLSGIEQNNSLNTTHVFDPNISHANFLYNLYDVEYIKNIADVLFVVKSDGSASVDTTTDVEQQITGGGGGEYGFNVPNNGSNNQVPQICQNDARWKSDEYGYSTIGSGGCLPTSLAMVLSYLDNTQYSPKDIVDNIVAHYPNKDSYYVKGAGSYTSLVSTIPKWYGHNVVDVGLSNLMSYLNSGCPVVMLCHSFDVYDSSGKDITSSVSAKDKASEFTSEGHYVVITGIDSDGYIHVNDTGVNKVDKAYNQYKLSDFNKGKLVKDASGNLNLQGGKCNGIRFWAIVP